jgi:hypothetical protein
MSSLRELQQRAYRAIALEEDLGLVPGARGPAQARLAVYRNNARVTFEKTLAATYPVVKRLVGDPCFRGLARELTRESPSRSGDLGRFGGELPALLDVYYRDTSFEYLADVARLEWAYAEAETAADAAPLDFSALRGVDPEEYAALRFVLQPSARFVSSRYPVLTIWGAHQATDVKPVALNTGAEHVLLLRGAADVRLHGLDGGAFAFARSLADGETLESAHETALAAAEDFDLNAALARFAALNLFTDFRRSFR